jgi:hypothetical protein
LGLWKVREESLIRKGRLGGCGTPAQIDSRVEKM